MSQEKSVSWIITAEALIVGAAFGIFLGSKDAHPALATTLALVVALIIRQAIVYVEQIFWVWTIGLGLGAHSDERDRRFRSS